MKKLLYFFSICIILCITSSSVVFADGHSASGHEVWDGVPPYKNIPPLSAICYEKYQSSNPDKAPSYEREYVSVNCGPYGVCCYYNNNQTRFMSFSLNQNDLFCTPNSFNNTPRSFNTTFNGQTYTVYYYFTNMYSYSSFTLPPGNAKPGDYSYTWDIRGVTVYDKAPEVYYKQIAEYFLFGIGDLDYDMPAQDIADESLDIVGLLGSVSDTYTDDGSFGSTLKNAWNSFIQGLFDLLPDGIGEAITSFSGTDNLFASQLGNVRTTVPGIQLIWDSPDILHSSSGDDPITYTFWIDGYATADLAIYGENYHSSVTFHKLQLRSSYIYYNPSLIYYYSSNQDYQVILDYIISNTNFYNGGASDLNQTVLNTTISRIYIQASKVDENGDNHFGAVSYVDFSTGSPVVFEGVTDSIDDIESSDSDTGTTNTVTQDYTVSGDTIYYGDTITNNNITNNISAGGLVVGNGLGLLNAGISLIRAVLEMIKLLFVSYLIPFITLGWTGHT